MDGFKFEVGDGVEVVDTPNTRDLRYKEGVVTQGGRANQYIHVALQDGQLLWFTCDEIKLMDGLTRAQRKCTRKR